MTASTKKPHGMTGNRNAAKPASERISGARIDVAVGPMLPRIEAAAQAAVLSRSAWLRRAIEQALKAEGH